MLNSRCRTILTRSVRTFVAVMWGAIKPLANIKMYQSVRVLPDGVIHRETEKIKKREKENRKDVKVKSRGPTARATNCFHCNVISTSRHIDTSSAIINRLFNMPKPGKSCMCVLEDR